MSRKVKQHSEFTELDMYLFRTGKHNQLYKKFGAHPIKLNDEEGVYFAVYAPGARSVQVIGEFNFWGGEEHELYVRWDESGIWEGFIAGINVWDLYKYKIFSNHDDVIREKSDPFARSSEVPPRTASLVHQSGYEWKDSQWMNNRHEHQGYHKPMSVYEVHLGSWMRKENNEYYKYHEVVEKLVGYVKDMSFTHIEFMPLAEHPYLPSWGYQITGYFSPTSRFGTPDELKFLIDAFHQEGIGVIMDWVPAHFPSDAHGLGNFDGSNVYEHPDHKKGFHPDWNSLVFNYERNEVRSFLKSSANFWLEEFHVDGLRVDAVASMLYLDYSREDGGWEPNELGGKENLAAISFLKELNTELFSEHPSIHMIAEESTAFPGITKPVDSGGLGFSLKWMMGWMNDTLEYFSKDPVYRKYHHNTITFSMVYAYSENYVLPFSHDEVVHGKGPMIDKMPGDEWQKFANLRALYGYMYGHPGSKMLFMGNEFGQRHEWNHNYALDWYVLDYPLHKGLQNLVKGLNELLTNETCLSEKNYESDGFRWVDHSNGAQSILSFLRFDESGAPLLIVCNFTPVTFHDYHVGVPQAGTWKELLNTDAREYEGSGVINEGELVTQKVEAHGQDDSLSISIPPLATTFLKLIRKDQTTDEEE